MYKIKLQNKISKAGLAGFPSDFTCSEDMDNPDGIIVRSADMHETQFGSNLLCIGRAGAGTNNIPSDRCSKEGIVVFNTPGANANAVKELAVCALMLSSRKISDGIEWAKTLKGQSGVAALVEKGKSAYAGPEIAGKTLGIIGLGAIGANFASAATALGMTVYGYDPYMTVDAAWSLSRSVLHATDIKTIYEKSDYISVHVPLTDGTRGMINADTIAAMKDGVRILNLARGELVCNAAISAALESGKVACYLTDFPSEETLEMKNTVNVPHLGASTPESEENCAEMAVAQVADYILNGNIRNSVNFPDLVTPRAGLCRLCVIHENKPAMINIVTEALGKAGINIDNMANKSKKDIGYTVVDTDSDVTDELAGAVLACDGILRVRIIK